MLRVIKTHAGRGLHLVVPVTAWDDAIEFEFLRRAALDALVTEDVEKV